MGQTSKDSADAYAAAAEPNTPALAVYHSAYTASHATQTPLNDTYRWHSSTIPRLRPGVPSPSFAPLLWHDHSQEAKGDCSTYPFISTDIRFPIRT